MPGPPAQPALLSGRITRAADGTAIAGAVVVVAVERHAWPETAPPIVVTSAADGRWAVRDVAPGSYVLTVNAIGFAPDASDVTAVSAGEQRTAIDIALTAGGALVSGTVSTDTRRPVANARVTAYRDNDGPYFIAFSGADGRYQLSLAAGQYQLGVTHDEYRRAWENISPSDTPAMADFVLVPGAVVRGQVVARDSGKPIPDAAVDAFGGRDSSSAQAGPDGAFELRGLHDGSITITARAVDGLHTFEAVAQGEWRCDAVGADGSARASIAVRGESTTITLALDAYASVRGTAVSALTGQPVAGITVMTRGTNAATDANGRFTVERVPAGSGELILTPRDQLGVGHDKYSYTAKPGERLDLGHVKVLPPRTGDVGTFGLGLEVRGDAPS